MFGHSNHRNRALLFAHNTHKISYSVAVIWTLPKLSIQQYAACNLVWPEAMMFQTVGQWFDRSLCPLIHSLGDDVIVVSLLWLSAKCEDAYEMPASLQTINFHSTKFPFIARRRHSFCYFIKNTYTVSEKRDMCRTLGTEHFVTVANLFMCGVRTTTQKTNDFHTISLCSIYVTVSVCSMLVVASS